MVRNIQDQDYIECLVPMYRRTYLSWKQRMVGRIDRIAADFNHATPEEVMAAHHLSPRDVALMVRLNYLTAEEAERFGLQRIVDAVPL